MSHLGGFCAREQRGKQQLSRRKNVLELHSNSLNYHFDEAFLILIGLEEYGIILWSE